MRRWMVAAGAVVFAAVGFVVASSWMSPAPSYGSGKQASDCPALAQLDPALVALSVEELETEIVERGVAPPTLAKNQLAGFDSAVAAYAPGAKSCAHRTMLIHAVATQRGLRSREGLLWYYGVDSGVLRAAILDGELTTQWTAVERERVVEFVESSVLPHLAAETPADRDHWRKLYLGMIVACHAGDAEIERIGARRQTSGCMDFSTAIADRPIAPAPRPDRRPLSIPRPRDRQRTQPPNAGPSLPPQQPLIVIPSVPSAQPRDPFLVP